MGLFSDLFSNNNAQAAAEAKKAGLLAGRTEANAALDKGFTTATGYYDKALVPFSDLYTKGIRGYDTYLDATGANGPEGIARAGATFKAMPGYSGGLTTGLDLLERRAAARGDLGGGNTSADTIRFASDYDAQKYKDFVSALSGQSGVATAGAAGQGAILGQEGSLAADIGSKKANYGWNTETGIGNANAEAEMAKQQASANFWSALMGGAKLATQAFGGGGGFPSFGFGGGANTPGAASNFAGYNMTGLPGA
jgi:hypothetical protein